MASADALASGSSSSSDDIVAGVRATDIYLFFLSVQRCESGVEGF